MDSQTDTLEKIYVTIVSLRQDARRRFPKDLWKAIINLTKIHSIEKICLRLNISPIYLKRKIQQSQEPTQIDFQELPHHTQERDSDVIVIELSSNSGLKARIQGPVSCLSCLKSLFGGN